jgi:hypothetical protein
MGVVSVVQLTLVGVVASAAGVRLPALFTTPGELGSRALTVGLVCLDCSLALEYPPLYWAVYRLLGHVAALPQLVQYAATIAAGYTMQLFTLSILRPPGNADALRHAIRVRRRWLLGTLAGLVVCYVLGPLRLGIPLIPPHGSRDPGVLAYVAVTEVYLTVAVLDILRICWTNRNTERRFLRLGLNLTATGCAFAVVYSMHKLAYFAATAMGASIPWAESGSTGVQWLFLTPALVCVSVGITIPILGPQINAWRIRRTDYRDLDALASALSAATTHRAANARPPRMGSRHARLLNRVIGIRDCLVGPLRPHLDARVYDTAYQQAIGLGIPDDDARILAEAVCIGVALQHRRHPGTPSRNPPPLRFGADLDTEAAWLARVSRAYTHSPLVRDMITQLDPGALPSQFP